MLKSTALRSLCLVALITSCKGKTADAIAAADMEETTQQIGDAMSSIDETGGTSGAIAGMMKRDANTFARYAPGNLGAPNPVSSLMLPSAEAAACSTVNFGSCSSSHKVRTFGGCTVGSATFTGNVDFAFAGAGAGTCVLTSNGDSITRTPSYTMTGLRSATLTVSKTGTFGQTVTMISNTGSKQFRFDNDGIRRAFAYAGTTLMDTTTTVTVDSLSQPMHVVSGARSSRTLNDGKLTVTNNLSGSTCSFAPSNVTWNGSCNCAVSGAWNGSCSDGTTSTVSLTGCGTAQATYGTTTTNITFDRCY